MLKFKYIESGTKKKATVTLDGKIVGEFGNRSGAVKCAKSLSSENGGKEVRMTDNAKLLQGGYFTKK